VKIPKSVRVGPFDFGIVVDKSAITEEEADQRSPLYGSTDKKKARIVLHPQNAECVQRETLLHEVLHAVNCVSAIDADMGTEDEERFVRRTAPVLLSVLRDNPHLVAYLTAAP
jgi:hypothetical protein